MCDKKSSSIVHAQQAYRGVQCGDERAENGDSNYSPNFG